MVPRPWFTSGFVTVIGVLLTTLTLLLLAIRQHDVERIQWLIDQNGVQDTALERLRSRQDSVFHELERIDRRLDRLEQQR